MPAGNCTWRLLSYIWQFWGIFVLLGLFFLLVYFYLIFALYYLLRQTQIKWGVGRAMEVFFWEGSIFLQFSGEKSQTTLLVFMIKYFLIIEILYSPKYYHYWMLSQIFIESRSTWNPKFIRVGRVLSYVHTGQYIGLLRHTIFFLLS